MKFFDLFSKGEKALRFLVYKRNEVLPGIFLTRSAFFVCRIPLMAMICGEARAYEKK